MEREPADRNAGEDASDAQRRGEIDTDYSEIDALIARTQATLDQIGGAGQSCLPESKSLFRDLDWDEEDRLREWQMVLAETADLPPVLQAAVVLDAWDRIQVLRNMPWLGRLLAAAVLHKENVTSGSHLVAISVGLKSISIDRRRSSDRDVRLMSIVHAFKVAGEVGLKEHDRLALATQMLQRKLMGKRTSSKLPELVHLVTARPLVSAAMIADILKVTPRAALRIVEELGLRELTGRGRFRAWGLL